MGLMARFQISRDYLVRFLTDLLNTPSPTGDTDWAISFVEQELQGHGITCYRTYKGALVAALEGLKDDRPRALTAHVDTLGAMVSEIKKNGRLKLKASGLRRVMAAKSAARSSSRTEPPTTTRKPTRPSVPKNLWKSASTSEPPPTKRPASSGSRLATLFTSTRASRWPILALFAPDSSTIRLAWLAWSPR